VQCRAGVRARRWRRGAEYPDAGHVARQRIHRELRVVIAPLRHRGARGRRRAALCERIELDQAVVGVAGARLIGGDVGIQARQPLVQRRQPAGQHLLDGEVILLAHLADLVVHCPHLRTVRRQMAQHHLMLVQQSDKGLLQLRRPGGRILRVRTIHPAAAAIGALDRFQLAVRQFTLDAQRIAGAARGGQAAGDPVSLPFQRGGILADRHKGELVIQRLHLGIRIMQRGVCELDVQPGAGRLRHRALIAGEHQVQRIGGEIGIRPGEAQGDHIGVADRRCSQRMAQAQQQNLIRIAWPD
jgi:hypothetical protein